MPRSHDPRNYPTWMLTIADKAMSLAAPDEFKFKYGSEREAIRDRNNLYSFIKSLEREAEKQEKQGKIELTAIAINRANAMRGYLFRVLINPNGTTATLQIINRNKDGHTPDVAAQLDAQLAAYAQKNAIEDNAITPVQPKPRTLQDLGYNIAPPPNTDERTLDAPLTYPDDEEMQDDK